MSHQKARICAKCWGPCCSLLPVIQCSRKLTITIKKESTNKLSYMNNPQNPYQSAKSRSLFKPKHPRFYPGYRTTLSVSFPTVYARVSYQHLFVHKALLIENDSIASILLPTSGRCLISKKFNSPPNAQRKPLIESGRVNTCLWTYAREGFGLVVRSSWIYSLF